MSRENQAWNLRSDNAITNLQSIMIKSNDDRKTVQFLARIKQAS